MDRETTSSDVQDAADVATPQRRRNPRSVRVVLAVVVAALALLLVGAMTGLGPGGEPGGEGSGEGGGAGGSTLRPGQVAGRGDMLPAMELPAHDGTTIDLSDLRGRPVVINFFASWCAPCVAEMPQFEQVHQDLGDSVELLGIASTDTLEEELDLIERTGVTYPTARDPLGEVMGSLGVVGLPSTVFVDGDGRIVEYHVGELDAQELRSLIDEHLL